jgi:hypothetical protein
MPSSVWAWALAGLLGAAFAAHGDSWVVDGEARGAVKEKSTVWSLSIEAPVVETIAAGTNGIPTSGAVTGYVESVAGPLRAGLTAVDGRLGRAEIDLLNNYLFDTAESVVGTYPLTWGFADTFATTNAVRWENMRYDAEAEALRVRLQLEAGEPSAALTMHFPMNESNASTYVVDTIGADGELFAGSGSANTADRSATGLIGGALHFTAADATHVQSGEEFNWAAYRDCGITLACWFRRTRAWDFNYSQNALVCAGGYYGGGAYYATMWMMLYQGEVDSVRWLYAGYYAYGYYDECGVPAGAAYVPPVGEWVHVATTYDPTNTTWIFYVDGVGVATNAAAAVPQYVSSQPYPLSIGVYDGEGSKSADADGIDIDDVRLYDRALTADEVAEIWADGAGTEGDDVPGGGPPVAGAVAVLESVQRTYAEAADEGYLAVQVEAEDATTATNLLGFISADAGATWAAVAMEDKGSIGAGVRLLDGAGVYGTPGTSMAVRIVVTNEMQGLTVHGWAYGRR